MDEREERIRERAHRLWEEEGRPDGRAEDHWFQAKEIVALEDGHDEALKPIGSGGEPVEPIEALTNAGEFPTLTDQGEMQPPHLPDAALDAGAAADGETPSSQVAQGSAAKAAPRRRTSNAASALR